MDPVTRLNAALEGRCLIRRLLMASLLLCVPSVAAQDLKLETTVVSYFEDSVAESDGEDLRLLGGTSWILGLRPLLPILPVTRVFVIVEQQDGRTIGYFNIRGRTHVGMLVGGRVAARQATRTWVTREMGDGAVLVTADGRFWSVPRYDQYNTTYWIPPYEVLIIDSESSMLNIEEGERIWVRLER